MAKFNLSKETRNPFGQIRGLRVPPISSSVYPFGIKPLLIRTLFAFDDDGVAALDSDDNDIGVLIMVLVKLDMARDSLKLTFSSPSRILARSLLPAAASIPFAIV